MTRSGMARAALVERIKFLFLNPIYLDGSRTKLVNVVEEESSFVEMPENACIVVPRGITTSEIAEFGASQPVYLITVTLPIEFHAGMLEQAEADLMRETIIERISDDIVANPTLDGTADNTEVRDFDPNEFGQEGTLNIASGILTVMAEIYSTKPL